MILRERLVSLRSEWGVRIVSDPHLRSQAIVLCGLTINFLYALYHGLLGLANLSLWFCSLFVYYTILGVMRLSVLLSGRIGSSASGIAPEFVARLSGVMLVFLSIVLAAINYISLSRNTVARYETIPMITIAVYTFAKITLAIVRAVRRRAMPPSLLTVIHRIGYAETAASLLTLQRSMIVSFGTGDDSFAPALNAATGAAVCLFVLLLGIFMAMDVQTKSDLSAWISFRLSSRKKRP